MDISRNNSGYGQDAPAHGSRLTVHGSDEINLLDYWRVIWKYKKMIVAIVFVASIAAVVMSLLAKKTYRADAVIMSISSKGGGGGGLSSLASQFGGLASLAGVNIGGSSAGDAEKIVAILKSRTLAENVINREHLMPIFFKDKWDAASLKWKTNDPNKQPNMEDGVKAMRRVVTITDDKKSKTIRVTGIFFDQKITSAIVNTYLDELQNFISSNAFTTAKRNRIFIEGQLAQNKEDLLEAGKEINEFYRGNRVSSADAKVDVPVSRQSLTVNPATKALAGVLEGESIRKDEKIKVADASLLGQEELVVDSGSGSGMSDPAIGSLLEQKSDIEKRLADANMVKNVPQQVYLSYLMLRRELLGKVNALLTTQYEMAKIEESKEDLAFQVIDRAVPPVRRASPKRAQICIMSFMAALFGAIFLAFFREYLERMKAVHQGK